ncbi:hypothetical protein U9M48_038512 [Paspalum notatum var. saurae]|uniref:Phytocyanin domain-containing protein n=1 Tax=Paspalum notatum var. saurae TaxID=547442 RepID=A0AAQ3UH02_PASNO
MASRSSLIALLVVVSCAAAASATQFTVGDSSGWTIGPNYSSWTSGKTFTVGDTLLFNFATGAHDVLEVSKSDYDSCTANALNTFTNGPATVTLTAGTHYYICGISGHCGAGMKLAVSVGSGAPAPGGSPGTAPAPGGSPGTPSAPSSASARLAAAPALAVAAGVLVKLALF